MSDSGWHQRQHIHPETEEVVDDISRTAAMRVAQDEKLRASRRTTADVIAVLEDRQWFRGWLIGATTGVPIGIILYKVYLAIWG